MFNSHECCDKYLLQKHIIWLIKMSKCSIKLAWSMWLLSSYIIQLKIQLINECNVFYVCLSHRYKGFDYNYIFIAFDSIVFVFLSILKSFVKTSRSSTTWLWLWHSIWVNWKWTGFLKKSLDSKLTKFLKILKIISLSW